MALGTLGSTLNDELNRLANGGTYRDMNQMVDEALAAKQWANRENINPYSTDTVGILNEIAGLGLDKRNWLDFNGVCNYIAGTTGLPAAAALRQVYPTTDLLTGVASYYVDATAPTNWGSLGYVRLNGVSGNYLSVPDSDALDVTGDLDVRVRVAMDDWTPTTGSALMGKWLGAGNQRSWYVFLNTDGTINLVWSNNGTTIITKTSTVATGITDGAVKWVRATLDVDNGSSGNDVKFWLSDDGNSWSQLGSTITTAGVTSVYAGTAVFELGSFGGGASLSTGNFYRAQVLNGIGGTTVLDVNIATDYRSSNQSFFTATTGQTVTVNGVDTIANLGAAGSLLPTTLGSSTAADSNDPKFLDFTGTNYVYLPGVASNFLSVPDAAPLRITGDIDLRARVALDDWTPAAATQLVSKYGGGGNIGYAMRLDTDGRLRFQWSADGTALNNSVSTVATGVADGATKWVRATMDVDNGASGNNVQFFTSDDGTSWTQLGSTVTTAGTTSLFASTQQVEIGSRNGGNDPAAAKVFRAQILNGIGGTTVLDVDTSVITAGSATSFTALTGQTVTINRSSSGRKTVAVTQPTWLFGTDDYMEVNNRYMSSGTYLYLPGVASNYASTPDANVLDITGNLDIRCKVALDDWTPSVHSNLVSKWDTNQLSYELSVTTTGLLALQYSTTGTTAVNITSTAVTGITDGATKWVRATLQVNNGAGGNDVIFYTSDDGTNWTQLGATVTTAGTVTLFSGTAPLAVGARFAGTNAPARGKFFRAQVRNGINGTVAFDANFETSITSLNQASFTESSANAATVTINRSGSAYRSAGITTAGYLYPGATNTFTASATDYLNFGATNSFTVLGVFRTWQTTSTRRILSKRNSSETVGYELLDGSPASGAYHFIGDGTNTLFATPVSTSSAGTLFTLADTYDRSAQTATITRNGTASATASISTIGSPTSLISLLTIGAFRPTSPAYYDIEFMAGAIFRTALTTAQIRQISNYFANREVYL